MARRKTRKRIRKSRKKARVKPRSKIRKRVIRVTRSHHKKKFRKLSRAAKLEVRIKALKKTIRQQTSDIRMRDHALKELTLTQRVRFTPETDEGDDEGDEDQGFQGHVKGEIPVEGYPGAYELPYILKSADFDFEDAFDYDDFSEDVGDEENADIYSDEGG